MAVRLSNMAADYKLGIVPMREESADNLALGQHLPFEVVEAQRCSISASENRRWPSESN